MAEKRADFEYNAVGQLDLISRYANLAGTQLVATSDYTFDNAGRLTGLAHAKGAATLANYGWTFDTSAASAVSVRPTGEGILPTKSPGYYTEYVHPTPGVKGPGAQRIVTGQGCEVYYTPDHYRTLIPLKPGG